MTERQASESGRPTAASVIAELWAEREQTVAPPPVPPPTAARRPRQSDGGGEGKKGLAAAVVIVGLLLGAGVGVFMATSGIGQPSKERFVAQADALCRPANGAVAAIAKPTSYPELATAATALVTAIDGQLAGLRKLELPGGAGAGRAAAVLTSMAETNDAGRSLQDAAVRKDDAATAAATQQVRASAGTAATEATGMGMAACATGMQPGVDAVVGGATGVVKAAFVAKADSLCRGSVRAFEAIPEPRSTTRDLARYLGQVLQVADKLTADLKALTPPPGDEASLAEIWSSVEKANEKGREARAAALANDRSRYMAVGRELTTLDTAANAKLDAYGLAVCGSNFGL